MRNTISFLLYFIVSVYCHLSRFRKFTPQFGRVLEDNPNCTLRLQSSSQILTYEENNNIARIYFIGIISDKDINITVTFKGLYEGEANIEKECTIAGNSFFLSCTFNNITEIPPNDYRIAFSVLTCTYNENTIGLPTISLSQTSKIDGQISVISASFENNKCMNPWIDFQLTLSESISASSIKGTFLDKTLQKQLSFTCDSSTSNIIPCRANDTIKDDYTYYYSILSLHYIQTGTTTRKVAYIETKKTVPSTNLYNPLNKTATSLIQNVDRKGENTKTISLSFLNELTTFELTFINQADSTTTILTEKDTNSCTIESVEKKNLTCTFNDTWIAGVYRIEYKTACGNKENLDVTVNLDVLLVFNYPDLSSTTGCMKQLENFTITSNGKEEKTDLIEGRLRSQTGTNTIPFTCTNLINNSSNQKITCTTSGTQQNGVYYIEYINYQKSGSTTKYEAFLLGDTTYASINSNYVPVGTKTENIFIDYLTSKTITIPFLEQISTVPAVYLQNEKKYNINCLSNNRNLICTIDDPAKLPPSFEYTVFVTNACGKDEDIGLTVKTSTLKLGSISFTEQGNNCVNTISTFKIAILKYSISAAVKGELSIAKESSSIYKFTCDNINIDSDYLFCTLNDEIKVNGNYFVSVVNYTPLSSNYETKAELTDKTTNIIFNDQYNPMSISSSSIQINYPQDNVVTFTFQKNLNNNVDITFIEQSYSLPITITCTHNSNILSCPISQEILPGGTYKIQYQNACGEENPNLTIVVKEPEPDQTQVQLGDPSFDNTKCISGNYDFTIEIISNSYTLTSIKGILTSKTENIKFECNDAVSSDKELKCKVTEPPKTKGSFYLSSVTLLADSKEQTGNLQNRVSFINYSNEELNYPIILEQQKTQIIKDKATEKVKITFQNNVEKEIFFQNVADNLNNSISCTQSSNNSNIECDVSKLNEGAYNLYYTNECGMLNFTGVTVYIYNLPLPIFGKPSYNNSCCNSIPDFSIPIEGNNETISSTSVFYVSLRFEEDNGATVNLTCKQNENFIQCLDIQYESNKNGKYYLYKIEYNVSEGIKEGIVTDKTSYINYHSLYSGLISTAPSKQILNFVTRSNITIPFSSQIKTIYPVELRNTSTALNLTNCSISSQDSSILTCSLDKDIPNGTEYSTWYKDPCSLWENTNIAISINKTNSEPIFVPNTNLGVDPSKFSDPRYDNDKIIYISFLCVSLVFFLL